MNKLQRLKQVDSDHTTAAAECRRLKDRLKVAQRRLSAYEERVKGKMNTAADNVNLQTLRDDVTNLRSRLHDFRGRRDVLADKLAG